jgi:carboxypeptidase Taq
MEVFMTPTEAYEQLRSRSKDMSHLGSALATLHWDQRTNIPVKGHAHRAEVLSSLAGMLHKMATDPAIGDLLAAVEGTELAREPLSVEAVNIREWRRWHDRAVKIPQELAVNLAKAAAEGQAAWEQARPANDWPRFEPHLERIVELKREQADALGYEDEPYDALLDAYEQGETAKGLEPTFAELIPSLVDLLNRIKGSSRRPDESLKHRGFPIPQQEVFALMVAERMGYDLSAGRLDVSAHPFTTAIGPADVRITTRYTETYFNEAFFAVIHETGHALYHQGLPVEHWGTPFCGPISLGINESQSRMWENMVARSLSFWKHFFPEAQKRFESLRDVFLEDFYFSVNEVTPSLIRVEADEVTYNLHILVRFQLELAICRGDLTAKDLPLAWNEKMQAYLGLTPPDYSQGVMQDVHWSGGAIGYFPTYTLGNLYAAQFYAKAQEELGNLESLVEAGELLPLRDWLRRKIHSQGRRYLPKDLARAVTGESLNPRYLIEYLNRKYGDLYGI